MKTTKQSYPNQDRVSRLRKSYRRNKQLIKYRNAHLEEIQEKADNKTIKFYLKQIENLHRQRIFLEKQLGVQL